MRILLPLALLLPGTALAQATAPTDILWYHGEGGSLIGQTAFDNYIDTLGGDVLARSSWSMVGDLSDYRFIVLARPTANYSDDQIDDINAYIESSGIVVVIGDSEANVGVSGIDALNDLTSRIGVNIQFTTHNFQNPSDGTVGSDCTFGNGGVQNDSPFLNLGTPIAVVNSGDLTVSAPAQVLQTVGYNIADVGADTARILARQDLTLVASDYQTFTGDNCGEASKEVMWRNLWDLHCDRDEDGSQDPSCGGFDCDDTDPHIGNTFQWADADGDGYGDFNTPAPCEPDAIDNSEDCDDSDPAINPDATEVCDGVDNDCDLDIDSDAEGATSWYTDFDGDGFGRDADVVVSCTQPEGRVDNNDDCADGDDEIHPDAPENCGNNVDDDCDGDVNENCSTPTPRPTGGNPDDGKCSAASGSGLVGLPLLVLASGLIRRRERR